MNSSRIAFCACLQEHLPQSSRPASDVGRYFRCRHIAAQRLGPVQQLVMSRVRRIAKLGVLAGGTLSPNRLEINRRKDGVLGLGTSGGSFLEQRYRGLTAARAMKDVNIQLRHDSFPVVEASICLAPKRKLRRQSRVSQDQCTAQAGSLPYAQRLPGAFLSPELLSGRSVTPRRGEVGTPGPSMYQIGTERGFLAA